jgi:hypothetical protein
MDPIEDCNVLTVAELKERLKKAGLKVNDISLKWQFCERWENYLKSRNIGIVDDGNGKLVISQEKLAEIPKPPAPILLPKLYREQIAPMIPKREQSLAPMPPKREQSLAPMPPPRAIVPLAPPRAKAPISPRGEGYKLDAPSSLKEYDDCLNMSYRDVQNELSNYGQKMTGTHEELCRRLIVARQVEKAKVAPIAGVQRKKSQIFTISDCPNWTVPQLQGRLREVGISPGNRRKDELCEELDSYEKSQLGPTKKIKTLRFGTQIFSVPQRLYNAVSSGPQEYKKQSGKPCKGISYVFGGMLDLNEYVPLGTQTVQDNHVIIFNEDSQELWRGDIMTNRASIYVHYNREGEIDSFIVEQDCLFRK